jgi:hypothetical protein
VTLVYKFEIRFVSPDPAELHLNGYDAESCASPLCQYGSQGPL